MRDILRVPRVLAIPRVHSAQANKTPAMHGTAGAQYYDLNDLTVPIGWAA